MTFVCFAIHYTHNIEEYYESITILLYCTEAQVTYTFRFGSIIAVTYSTHDANADTATTGPVSDLYGTELNTKSSRQTQGETAYYRILLFKRRRPVRRSFILLFFFLLLFFFYVRLRSAHVLESSVTYPRYYEHKCVIRVCSVLFRI